MSVETPSVPKPEPRRIWQLPLFALGVTAAILAWRYFPPKPANADEQFQRNQYSLRQILDRKPVSIPDVESLVKSLEAGSESLRNDPQSAYILGSGYLALAEQGNSERSADCWAKAEEYLNRCDPNQLAEKAERARCLYRSAKAAAAMGKGDAAQLLTQLETVPPNEDTAERSRLIAETCQRLVPSDFTRAKVEWTAYLSGPPRGTPERQAENKIKLANLCAGSGDAEKARTWLKEIGETAPANLQAQAKIQLAKMALAERDTNEAMKLFQSTEQLPGLPGELRSLVRYETGRCLAAQGNATAARDCYTKAADGTGPASTAAFLRLAEAYAAEGNPKASGALESAFKEIKSPNDWTNPSIPLPEVRTICESAIASLQKSGQFESALSIADRFAPLAENLRDRELAAETLLAWGNSSNTPDSKLRLKRAGEEFAKLAESRTDAREKSNWMQKASSAFLAAGEAKSATLIGERLGSLPGALPDSIAQASLQRAEALIAQAHFTEGVELLKTASQTNGAIGTRATVMLATTYIKEGKRRAAVRETETEGRKMIETAADLLGGIANKTYSTTEEQLAHQEALYELGRLQLNENFPGVLNYREAEVRFRRLVDEYPKGSYAERGSLYLGIGLSQLAQGANNGGSPPADAEKKFSEARKIFETLGASKDDWIRTQADIRLVHTLLYLKQYDTLNEVGPKLAEKYRGAVQELIVLNMLYSGYLQAKRADLSQGILDKMKKVYSDLPENAFTGGMKEYTKQYWADWFQQRK